MQKKLSFVLSGLFALLCFLHYFSLRPLWLDENFIYEDIKAAAPFELFAPLAHSQVFPRIHLILIKLFAQPLDYHVLALRLLPLICMLAAFWLWIRIYKRNADDDVLLFLLPLLAWVSAFKMSYYAAEFKPYAMDVLVVGLAVLLCRRFDTKDPPDKQARALAVFFPLTIFFSYAGVFVFWLGCYHLILGAVREKSLRLPALGAFFSAAICAGIFYWIDLRHGLNHSPLLAYWQGSFIDTTSVGGFFDTLGDGVKKLGIFWYGDSKVFIRAGVGLIPFFLFALFRYGIRDLRHASGKIVTPDALAFVLFLELFIFGALHKYPFTGERVTLFFAPFAFYLTAKGILSIKKPDMIRYFFLIYFAGYCAVCLVNTFCLYLKLYF